MSTLSFGASFPQSFSQVSGQDHAKVIVGSYANIVGFRGSTCRFDFGEMLPKLGQVGLTNRQRIGVDFGQCFQAAKQCRMAEWKVEFGGIEHLEHDDFMLLGSEHPQSGREIARIIEQITEEKDNSSPTEKSAQIANGPPCGRHLVGRSRGENTEQFPHLAGLTRRLHPHSRSIRESHQTNAVGLLNREIPQCRGQGRRHVKLRGRRTISGSYRPHLHRFTRINHQPGDQVGFLFVLLEVIPFGPRVDFPVDMADIVAGGVFAVLSELDSEAVAGTAVPTGEIALDHMSRGDFERINPGDDIGWKHRLWIIMSRMIYHIHDSSSRFATIVMLAHFSPERRQNFEGIAWQ